jgi:hypothetical protein
MSNLIYAKIDVTKIDKARLFEGKNGAKYLDLVLVPSTNSKFGDTHFITQSCTKEERQSGLKMPILGNAKEQPPREQHNAPPPRSAPAPRPASTEILVEDVPF